MHHNFKILQKMSDQKLLFSIESQYFNAVKHEKLNFAWQNNSTQYLAAADDTHCYIFSKNNGEIVDQLINNWSPIVNIIWSNSDKFLLCYHQKDISIWNADTCQWSTTSTTLNSEIVTSGAWLQQNSNPLSPKLSRSHVANVSSNTSISGTNTAVILGTNRGSLLFFYPNTQTKMPVLGKHNSEIIQIDGNSGTIVYLSQN